MTRVAWLDEFGPFGHLTRSDPKYSENTCRQTFCGEWTGNYSSPSHVTTSVTCVACRASVGSHESAAGLVLADDDGVRHQAVVMTHVTTHKDVTMGEAWSTAGIPCDGDWTHGSLERMTPGTVNCLACLATRGTT